MGATNGALRKEEKASELRLLAASWKKYFENESVQTHRWTSLRDVENGLASLDMAFCGSL